MPRDVSLQGLGQSPFSPSRCFRITNSSGVTCHGLSDRGLRHGRPPVRQHLGRRRAPREPRKAPAGEPFGPFCEGGSKSFRGRKGAPVPIAMPRPALYRPLHSVGLSSGETVASGLSAGHVDHLRGLQEPWPDAIAVRHGPHVQVITAGLGPHADTSSHQAAAVGPLGELNLRLTDKILIKACEIH